MPKILSFGSIDSNDFKQNPIKAFIEWISSLDKFTKLFMVTTIILVIVTPIIVKSIFTITQHANEDMSLEGLTNNLLLKPGTVIGSSSFFGTQTTITEASLTEKAIRRKDLMINAAKVDPDNFLLNALDSKATSLLALNTQQYTEKEVELEGVLYAEDAKESLNDTGKNVTQGQATSLLFQTYDSEGEVVTSYIVYITKDQEPELNKKVKIKGYLLDNILVPISFSYNNPGAGVGQAVAAATSPQLLPEEGDRISVGTKKLAAVIVTVDGFNEDLGSRGKFTKEDVAAFYFTNSTSVSSYISKASFQKMQLQGDITDVYDNVVLTGYSRQDLCDNTEEGSGKGFTKKINNIVKQRARALGKDFSQYDFIGYILPHIPESVCGWNAIARGIPGVHGNVKPYHFLNGDYTGYKKSTSTSYYRRFYAGILSHELAHNIGLGHAHGLNCGAKSVASYDQCVAQVYADRFDIIGGAWDYFPGISANNKLRLGYINSQNVKTVVQSGTYKLYSSSIPRPGQVQLLKIKRKDNSVYYIEYRSKQRADTGLPDKKENDVFKGAFIRLSNVPSYSLDGQWIKDQTYLIDMTRGDRNDSNSRYGFLLNPTLSDNKTFSDPANGIKIKQISHDLALGTADIEINLGSAPCVLDHPSVSFIPTTQSAYPGEKLTYQMTIKNKNNNSCSPSTYNIAPQLPEGWQVNLSKNPVTISSRERFVVTAEITSPISAMPLSQRIKFDVIDNANPTYKVTKRLAYVVIPKPLPTGTITASPQSCTVASGESTCNVSLTWATQDAPNPSVVTEGVGVYSNSANDTRTVNMDRESYTFILYSGTTELGRTTVTRILPPIVDLSIVKLIAVADSWVKKDNPTANYGKQIYMRADADPVALFYLKFDLGTLRGKTIAKATLNLTVARGDDADSYLKKGIVVKSASSNWKETLIDFNNKPDFGGVVASFTGERDNNEVIELDVTSYVRNHAGDLISLSLQNKGPDGVSVMSREAPSGNPTLVIEYR